MSYIVFDMEWNQPMCAAQPQKGRNGVKLSGEIIQIGAVRLDDNREIADTFSMCVRPCFYKRLNKRVKELTGIAKEELAAAEDFSAVSKKFFEFCGKRPILLSWGFDDVPILRQNLIAWGLDTCICENSYNLQTIFNTQTDGGKGQRSLAFALDHFGIVPDLEAHNAFHDAYHTALVAKHLDIDGGIAAYGGGSIGALWEHPLSDESFRVYKTKRDAFADEKIANIRCPICNRPVETAKWVTKGGGYYIALAKCPDHGEYIGRLRFSSVGESGFSAVRTVFRGSKFATEHYSAVFERSEKRKTVFKERMKEQKKQKSAERLAAQTETDE